MNKLLLTIAVACALTSVRFLTQAAEPQAWPSTIGVGEYEHFVHYGPDEVLIDVGCTLRMSAISSNYGFVEADKITEFTGRMIHGYRIPNVVNPSAPNWVVALGPDQGGLYVMPFQHLYFGTYEIEGTRPMTEAGANVGKNVADLGLIFLKPDGLSEVGQDLKNATEAIDPTCIQPYNGERFSPAEETYARSGYFIFKYQNDIQLSYSEQDNRLRNLLEVRASITELEVKARHRSPNVQHLARALQTKIALAQLEPSADLTATNANIAALITAAAQP